MTLESVDASTAGDELLDSLFAVSVDFDELEPDSFLLSASLGLRVFLDSELESFVSDNGNSLNVIILFE